MVAMTGTHTATSARLTARWYPLRPHAQQAALYRTRARVVAVLAGRRSGKTEIAKRRLVRALAESRPFPGRYFFGAPTERQAKRVAWDDLKALCPREWTCRTNESELFIETVFGSRLYLIGFDRPARFEGSPWDGGVLDESSDYKPGVFDRTVRPALADRGGWCWRIGVPKRHGPSAADYRAFCDAAAAGEYPGAACFAWPSSDILPAEEIAHARQTLDPKDYNEQFNARWETAGGAVFHGFDRQYNVRPVAYDSSRAIVVGSDFNVDPMCWVLCHRHADRLEAFDEIVMRDANTPAALGVLWGRYASHTGGWEFYGDAASQQRHTSASLSDYAHIANDQRFQRAGRTVHYPKANPPQADRFAATNALLCNADGQRRLFVDPRCKTVIADLERRAYKPGGREPDDAGDVGHMTDALGYIVSRLFPLKLKIGASSSKVLIRE